MLRTIVLASVSLVVLFIAIVNPKLKAQDARGLRTLSNKIRPLHKIKSKPGPGDWLANHKENGQTFRQYLKTDANLPTKQRNTIYLQPIGKFDKQEAQAVKDTAEFIRAFYGLPVKTLKTLPVDTIPAEARRVHPSWGDKQWLTTHILYQVLKPNRPRDAVAMLALTAHDLWPGEGWNFVFGQADLRQRVGVWSMYRNGKHQTPKQYALFLRRTLKTAVHELGHMLSIQHCTAYECCMNGSNNRVESDRAPLTFCPECVAKIWYGCRVDPGSRYERLYNFARTHQLKEDEAAWKKAAERIPPARRR